MSSQWYIKGVYAQSLLTPCNPIDYSPPGSSIHGVCQARILEWAAISYPRGSSQPRNRTCVSCIDRQILHNYTTWEALYKVYTNTKYV